MALATPVLARGQARVNAISRPMPPAAQAGVAHMFARQGAAGKDEIVVFRELSESPVYVMAFFDKDGTTNGNLEPCNRALKRAITLLNE